MEDGPSRHDMLFAQLVLMFQTAAMQHMGKLKNPLRDKIERDLDEARISIDFLEMLSEKKKGNLSPDEQRYLDTTLRDLRLNYVEEVAKDEAAARPQPSQEAAGQNT